MRIAVWFLVLAAPALYVVLCAFVSAFIAYPLHFILPKPLDFQGLVFRCAEIMLILGLFPLGRRLGIGWAEMGLADVNRQFWRQMRRGFGYGALMLGLHVLFLWLADIRVPIEEKLQWVRIVRLSFKGVAVGFAVALLEEPMFRGFLQAGLAKKLPVGIAVLAGSGYFAALHFLQTHLRPSYDEVRWDTGLMLVLDAFHNLPSFYPDSFLALFAAGVFLGCVRLLAPRTGLSYSIGVHAGWVFVLKATNPLSTHNFNSPWIRAVSPFDGTIGYLSASWTAVLVVFLAVRLIIQSTTQEPK